MRFSVLLAWRESRSPRRLLLMMASVTAGVAALVAIGSFTRNLQASVSEQARALLGADLAMGSGTAFTPRAESHIAQIVESGRSGQQEPQVARVTSFSAMAYVPRTAGARPVQAMAIEGGFPYYGTIETSPPGLWPRLGEGGGVLVDPSLLTVFDARVGDTLSLGESKLEIRGTVTNYPGDVGIRSALGPRVYLSSKDLAATGLLRFGSRARYDVYLELPPGVDAQRLADRNRIRLSAERVSIRTVTEDQRSLNNSLGRLGRFLSLIGLVALLLGGLGVASAVRALMKKKMETIAVLRCLGATAGQIFGAYLLQAMALGLVGSVVGAAIGVALQWFLPRVMRGLLPVDVAFAPAPASIAMGLALGAWVAGLFSLLPLLSIRDVPALAVLRRAFEPPARGRRDWRRPLAVLVLVLSIVGLSVLQAPSPGAGVVFAASIGVALGVLWGVAVLLTKAVRRFFPTSWPYVWRQGLANLYRPANQTAMVILALGFGAFLLDTVYLVHHNLLRDLRVGGTQDRPNLALFDIQPDQREGVRALMQKEGLAAVTPVPIVPMRIASLKGRSAGALLAEGTASATAEGPPRPGQANRWTVRREYRSTYRDTLGSSERVVAGQPWAPGSWLSPHPADEPVPISVEAGLAKEMGIGVGDLVTWDVQGVTIPSRVASLREVEWARFEPNFFVVFPEGPLASAPQTFLTLTRVSDATHRARLQRTVAEAFPNVTALDLAQVQEVIEKVIARVSLAIRFMALFSLAAGVIVLLGAVAASRDQRIREGVLLKTLGATRAQVARVILAEYLSLGTLASASALGLSLLGGWALLHFQFEAPFAIPAAPLAALFVGVVVLTAVIGLMSARDVFARSPLEALRSE